MITDNTDSTDNFWGWWESLCRYLIIREIKAIRAAATPWGRHDCLNMTIHEIVVATLVETTTNVNRCQSQGTLTVCRIYHLGLGHPIEIVIPWGMKMEIRMNICYLQVARALCVWGKCMCICKFVLPGLTCIQFLWMDILAEISSPAILTLLLLLSPSFILFTALPSFPHSLLSYWLSETCLWFCGILPCKQACFTASRLPKPLNLSLPQVS